MLTKEPHSAAEKQKLRKKYLRASLIGFLIAFSGAILPMIFKLWVASAVLYMPIVPVLNTFLVLFLGPEGAAVAAYRQFSLLYLMAGVLASFGWGMVGAWIGQILLDWRKVKLAGDVWGDEFTHKVGALIGLIFVTYGLAAVIGDLVPLRFVPRDFHINKAQAVVSVNPDQSLDVIEKITYDFRGDFTHTSHLVNFANANDITNFSVSEGGTVYKLDTSEQRGTMTINKDNENKKINAKWFFLARDEKRSFTVSYHVVNAVKLHFDVAELNWSFFGENREERIGPFEIFIYPSEKVDKNEVKAWIHDAPGSKVNILDGGKVEIHGSKVLTDDIPEARVLFPPRSFTAIAQDSNSKMKTKIVEEEITRSFRNYQASKSEK